MSIVAGQPALAQDINDALDALVSKSNLGTGIGNVLGPLVDFNSAGIPALQTTGRLVISKTPGTETVSDFATLEVHRTTAFSGGTGQNAVFRALGTYGADTGGKEWGIVSVQQSNSTMAGTQVLGGFFQGIRGAGGVATTWGLIADSIDKTGLSTSASGTHGQNGIELDVECNGADDATNTAKIGGKGNRQGIQMVASRYDATDTTQTEVSHGLWFGTGATSSSGISGPDAHTNWQSLLGVADATQIRSFLDSRGAITPAGSSNPVSAVIMDAGHVIDFNGGTAIDSEPGNTLSYVSSSLAYQVSGETVWSISDAGAVIAPSVSSAGTTLLLGTSGGTQITLNNVASTVNSVSITGAVTGDDPVITVVGDTNRNLDIQGAGTGALNLKSHTNIGNANSNFISIEGASTGSLPTIVVSGSDAARSFRASGHGTGGVVIGSGAAIATSAAGPFLMIPFGAGTPTGTPTDNAAGIAIYYDTSANKIWAYNGAWKATAALA